MVCPTVFSFRIKQWAETKPTALMNGRLRVGFIGKTMMDYSESDFSSYRKTSSPRTILE